jgi:hypothetical protein
MDGQQQQQQQQKRSDQEVTIIFIAAKGCGALLTVSGPRGRAGSLVIRPMGQAQQQQQVLTRV